MMKFTFTSTDTVDERKQLDVLTDTLKKNTNWEVWREEWQYVKEIPGWQVIIEIEEAKYQNG